jgi:ATP-dependent exoDNAse (exonuclease V) alpha subunit
VIAVGDSGQLPSVAAGGWFAALEDLHDGDPDAYIELKRRRDELAVHEHEADAVAAILADWNQAQQQHGLSQAVMIARDNTTRSVLNEQARQLLIHARKITSEGVIIADQEFRVGDRVIARRNDRHRDIDNGTLASITSIDRRTGTLTVLTDTGEPRLLDASYAAEHLEPAYALTGHGAQGATVQWAGVIGRAFEFTREWAYTSLSRARDQTRAYLIAEATETQLDREQYAPPEPQRTATETLEIMSRAIRRREAETLATQHVDRTEMPANDKSQVSLTPLTAIMEAGADHATHEPRDRAFEQHRLSPPSREPDWQLARQRSLEHHRGHGREM